MATAVELNEERHDVRGDGRIILYKREGLKNPKWQARIRVPNAVPTSVRMNAQYVCMNAPFSKVGVCSDCVDRFGHLIVSDRHVDRSRLNRLMPHQMLNRFDPNASLVKSSSKRASTAVTARLDPCALVDRFQPSHLNPKFGSLFSGRSV